MGRVVIVSRRHDQLAKMIMEKSYDAVVATNFKIEFQQGDQLCWLPLPGEAVDDEVQELATLIDQSVFLPTKIVMLAIAGSADDASPAQLTKWYGKNAVEDALAYQYAVKMIDEFEIPYTIIRALPLGDHGGPVKVIDEGEKMTDGQVGVQAAAEVILTALSSTKYRNQSIGIVPIKK